MNIFKFEFLMLKKSTIIWSIAVPFSLFFYMIFYPMIASDTAGLESIMESFPKELLAAFGMNANLPVSSLLGYFSLTMGMIYIPIAIQASYYGFHILSVEEREYTADFLLTKPVKRARVFISKILAALSSLAITNLSLIVVTLTTLFLIKGEDPLAINKILVLLSALIFIQLGFFSLSLLISVSFKKISSVLSFSMSVGFGLYMLSALGSILDFKLFYILSPYAHFDPNYILINTTYNWSLALISIALIVITLPLSCILYQRRNIASL